MNDDPYAPTRRILIKAVGFGAAVMGLGATLPDSAAAEGRPVTSAAPKRAQTTNTVNLYCHASSPVFDSSGNATMTVTCGNFGPDDATGSVSLKFLTPFFINVPSLPSVSGGTPSWLYQNTAPDVPSLFKVTFSGIAAGATITVPVSLSLNSNAPNIAANGRVIFTTDAGNTADVDSDLTRNVIGIPSMRSALATLRAGNSELYYTTNWLPAVGGGPAVSMPFHFYNGAGAPLHGTKSVSHFTFSTPFYAAVPTSGRPSGFSTLYENNDPAVPSIYRLNVPAGLGARGSTVPTTINVPFQLQSGTPVGPRLGTGIIVPTGKDIQGDQSVNFHAFGLISVRHAVS